MWETGPRHPAPTPSQPYACLQVAHALGRKVYVGAAKRGVMARIGLSPEYAALLTHDHLESNFHVLPMCKVGGRVQAG